MRLYWCWGMNAATEPDPGDELLYRLGMLRCSFVPDKPLRRDWKPWDIPVSHFADYARAVRCGGSIVTPPLHDGWTGRHDYQPAPLVLLNLEGDLGNAERIGVARQFRQAMTRPGGLEPVPAFAVYQSPYVDPRSWPSDEGDPFRLDPGIIHEVDCLVPAMQLHEFWGDAEAACHGWFNWITAARARADQLGLRTPIVPLVQPEMRRHGEKELTLLASAVASADGVIVFGGWGEQCERFLEAMQ